MSEWKECRIGDVCDTQTGPFGSQLHNEDYVEIGTPIVTVEHLGNKNFSTQNLPRVSEDDKARLSKYTLLSGDVVFSRVGAVDRCSYVSEAYNGWLFSGRCLRVRVKDDTELDSQFLYYHFSNEKIRTYIRNIAVGATMPSINTKLLNEVPISFPSLSEQKKIAAVLSSLDEKIETNRKINARLEELAQAIFKSWFIDFEPFGGVMPEDWKECNFDDVVEVIAGGTPKTDVQDYWDGNIPWISVKDFVNEPHYVMCTERTISTEGLTHSSTHLLQPGDTIISARGTVGAIAQIQEPMAFNQSCFGLRSKLKDGMYWLFFLIKNKVFELRQMSHGSVFDTINRKSLSSLQLLVPAQNILSLFHKTIDSIENRILQLSKESLRLAELRDTLLPKLMSDEIKIE